MGEQPSTTATRIHGTNADMDQPDGSLGLLLLAGLGVLAWKFWPRNNDNDVGDIPFVLTESQAFFLAGKYGQAFVNGENSRARRSTS